jgi:hypothetical protein
MAYKKQFATVAAKYIEGGSLCSDLSADNVNPADFMICDGWRRNLDSMLVREGWQLWQPNPGFTAAAQSNTGVASTVYAIEEIKSPAGKAAIVAVVGTTVRWFNYDTGAWVQIGSGFQLPPTGRRWQILCFNGYAIFNNAADLPFYWRIGDAAVTPIHQMREMGVAFVGYIVEYVGALIAADITEVNESYMATLMNSGNPYGLVPNPTVNTSRTQYRLVWSNVGDPLDWGATVLASAVAGSGMVTLAWPMASFKVGDEVILLGAGTSGGNLTTTIAAISGTSMTTVGIVATTISLQPVGHSTITGSIVGYYDIQDDGSAILAMMPLQNRLIVYRPFSIFIGVYTGEPEAPFQFDRTYQGERAMKFPYTLINIRGQVHMYAGATIFYTYKLGSLEPDVDSTMIKCANEEFFSRNFLGSDIASIYVSDNGITSEAMFTIPDSGGVRRTLCYNYDDSTASVISGDWDFRSSVTVRRPTAGNIPDNTESWFIMGTANGLIFAYGLTSKALTVMTRNGAFWNALMLTTHLGFGDEFNEKDLRTVVPLFNNKSGVAFPIVIETSTYKDVATPGVVRTTQVVPTPSGDTVVPTWQRAMYHRISTLAQINSAVVSQPSLAGYIAEADIVGTRSVTRMV